MSRIGKQPINVPKGIEIKIEGILISVKGPKGTLSRKIDEKLKLERKEDQLELVRLSEERRVRALHGLTRTLISNMVQGVSEGFAKELELSGVGYRAALEGKNLVLQIGYSHPVVFNPLPGIEFKVQGQTKVTVLGADKEMVGQVAANIRSSRPVEPYKGKGIKYAGEKVRRKAGKAASAGKSGG